MDEWTELDEPAGRFSAISDTSVAWLCCRELLFGVAREDMGMGMPDSSLDMVVGEYYTCARAVSRRWYGWGSHIEPYNSPLYRNHETLILILPEQLVPGPEDY